MTEVVGEPDYELVTANISGILRGRLDNNIIIQPSDVVYIPPGDVFYIAGEVKAPGSVSDQAGNHLAPGHLTRGRTSFQSQTRQGHHLPDRPGDGKFHRGPGGYRGGYKW